MRTVSPPRSNPISCLVALPGRGVSPGLACGPLRRNRDSLSADDVAGTILVLERTRPADLERILSCAGTVTFDQAPLSHAALLSRELGIPSVDLSRWMSKTPPGVPAGPILFEDAVVVLDGFDGELRFAVGLAEQSRIAVRRLYELLQPGRLDPEAVLALLEEFADLCKPEDGTAAAAAFTIEAGLLAGRLGSVAAQELFCALACSSVGSAFREQRRRIVARTVGRIGARRQELLEALRGSDEPAALDAFLVTERRQIDRDRRRLAALGTELPSALDSLDQPEKTAERRREQLRDQTRIEVRRAASTDGERLDRKMGSLSQLVERSRALGLAGPELNELRNRLRELGRLRAAQIGEQWLVPLEAGPTPSIEQVGGKAAGLFAAARRIPARCRIPRGFVLTTSAYRRHLLGGVEERLRDLLEAGAGRSELSRRARAAILAAPVPVPVAELLVGQVGRLPGERFTVRSSATLEDATAGSLAGLLDSELGLLEPESSVSAVRRVWASLWSGRALLLLGRMEESPLDAAVAVIVQEMVATRAAGVLTTRDPADGAPAVLVSAAAGLAEGVTAGEIPADLFRIDRATGTPTTTELGGADRRIEIDPAGDGTIEVPRTDEERNRPCLGEAELRALHGLACGLDPEGGPAVEVEFGFDAAGDLFVFQVRRRTR